MEKSIKAFVARDENGDLFFYPEKPTMNEQGRFIAPTFIDDTKHFASVKRGECKECTITIK